MSDAQQLRAWNAEFWAIRTKGVRFVSTMADISFLGCFPLNCCNTRDKGHDKGHGKGNECSACGNCGDKCGCNGKRSSRRDSRGRRSFR